VTPTHAQAAATLEEGNAALAALFGHLSPAEMTRPATIGGGEWSAKDLLGHVAFWEELAAQSLSEWRAGQRPAIESLLGPEATDAANARNQERTARQSLATVAARADAAHRTILEAIQAMSDEEWRASSFYADAHNATLADLLGNVLGAPTGPFQHAFAHLDDLRTYFNSLYPAVRPGRS
jgi:hypothetical protein